MIPDYLQVIDTPMDLRTVKEELIGGNYQSKSECLKDVRMIFTNSRHYNTNQRSRVSPTNVENIRSFFSKTTATKTFSKKKTELNANVVHIYSLLLIFFFPSCFIYSYFTYVHVRNILTYKCTHTHTKSKYFCNFFPSIDYLNTHTHTKNKKQKSHKMSLKTSKENKLVSGRKSLHLIKYNHAIFHSFFPIQSKLLSCDNQNLHDIFFCCRSKSNDFEPKLN